MTADTSSHTIVELADRVGVSMQAAQTVQSRVDAGRLKAWKPRRSGVARRAPT